jgi:hypothetical protein
MNREEYPGVWFAFNSFAKFSCWARFYRFSVSSEAMH